MQLSELLRRARLTPGAVDGDAEISSIVDDSRRAQPGALFVCRESNRTDSHQFLGVARDSGSVAALVHSDDGFQKARDLGYSAVLQVPAGGHEVLRACGLLCAALQNDPTKDLRLIGITGTNGKTTTAWMIRDALSALGREAGYLGTLGYKGPGGELALENTTPFPVELYEVLGHARRGGATDFVMEVSSHGLHEHRIAGLQFDLGVFTNLSQDHLDYHGTMEAYAEAKKKLFTEVPEASSKPYSAVLAAEDPYAAAWIPDLKARLSDSYRLLTYGEHQGEFQARATRVSVDSIELQMNCGGESATAQLGVGGMFNVANSRSAAAALRALGYSLAEIAQAMTSVRPVPGRFESVPNTLNIGIVVDYAHTPDALEKLLDSARAVASRRIITVFGCGGDRDRNKRPKMAQSASLRSDISIVTSDNPRTEDPEAIVDEVVTGIAPGRVYERVVDRREAVARAIELAEPGDIVVIAGKGHEDYQIIGRTKHPMDDRELAREGVARRGVSSK